MNLLVGCILLGYLFIKVRPSSGQPARWGPVLLGGLFGILGFVLIGPQFQAEIQMVEEQNPVYSPMAEMAVFVTWIWVGLLVAWGLHRAYTVRRRQNSYQEPPRLHDREPVESMLPIRRSYARPAVLMAAVVLLFTAGTALFRSSTRRPRQRG